MNPLLAAAGGAAAAWFLLRDRAASAAAAPAGVVIGGGGGGAAPVLIARPPGVVLGGAGAPIAAPVAVIAPPKLPPPIAVSPAPMPPAPNHNPGIVPPTMTAPARADGAPVLTGRWVWPVPRWQGRAPVISSGFGTPRPGTTHAGVDLMFARIGSDPFPVGSPNGSKGFVMPDAWMAIAASDGVLWSSGPTPRGFAVVIDHGKVATFYTHLSTLFVPQVKPPAAGDKLQRLPIKAGQPLGVIGADPQDSERLKHLHFELWSPGPADAVDPRPLMAAWSVLSPVDIAPLLPAYSRNAAKEAKRPDLVRVRGHERRWPGTAYFPPR